MTIDKDSFRVNFPEFASTTTYPDAEVTFWLALGYTLLVPDRWRSVLDYGVQLFVGHNLSLEFNARQAAARGQNPGFVMGNVTSGTVDKVSYTRDTHTVMDPKNGHWNLTIYGLRYIRLVNMAGAAPFQAGAGGVAGCQPWSGPVLTPPW